MAGLSISVTSVNIYKSALHKELNTSSGGLWRELEKAGNKAVVGAKLNVGVRTGRLRNSIHKRHLGNPTGQYLMVGSWTVDYALAHHEGTKPHIIAPAPGKALVFTSRSRMIRTPVPVRHPGTKANHYLTKELRHFRW